MNESQFTVLDPLLDKSEPVTARVLSDRVLESLCFRRPSRHDIVSFYILQSRGLSSTAFVRTGKPYDP